MTHPQPKPSHTPGPWTIEPDRNDQLCVYSADGHEWIALLPHQCLASIEAQQKINAHLIAAAPDLLSVLKSIAADASAYQWHKAANAAIAKAEGR